MDKLPRGSDLTAGEMNALRDVIARSAVSTGSVPRSCRARLQALGLIASGMGLLLPTPAGRIVARMLP